jgi:hypothetical protein
VKQSTCMTLGIFPLFLFFLSYYEAAPTACPSYVLHALAALQPYLLAVSYPLQCCPPWAAVLKNAWLSIRCTAIPCCPNRHFLLPCRAPAYGLSPRHTTRPPTSSHTPFAPRSAPVLMATNCTNVLLQLSCGNLWVTAMPHTSTLRTPRQVCRQGCFQPIALPILPPHPPPAPAAPSPGREQHRHNGCQQRHHATNPLHTYSSTQQLPEQACRQACRITAPPSLLAPVPCSPAHLGVNSTATLSTSSGTMP